MKVFSMAIRNLQRNRRRSLLAASSLCLSILLVIIMQGFMAGFLDSLVRNYTKNETGHINITTVEYRERARFMPIDTFLEDYAALSDEIRNALGNTANTAIIAPRIRFGVLLSSGSLTRQALALAGDPEIEKKLLMLDKRLIPGSQYCDSPGTVIIGEKLANDLGLSTGDEIKVVAQKADGGIGFKKLKISGLFKTNVNSLDESVFQMSLHDAQSLLGMGNGTQQLSILLPTSKISNSQASALSRQLESKGFSGLSVLPWTAIGEYPKIVAMAGAVYFSMFIVIALLGAFIIANIMTMVVLERKREIGILMSMGMKKSDLLSLFLLEGSMLGFIGSVAGGIFGLTVTGIFSKIGFDLTSSMAGFSWPLDNIIHTQFSIGAGLAAIALGTVVAAIVSWLPSWRAANLPPVEAIRSI